MKKSLWCVIMVIVIMLSSVPMTVSAQTKGEKSIVEAEADLFASTASDEPEIVSISAGSDMSAAVRADGSLWTWGCKDLKASGSVWGNYWSTDAQNQGLGIAMGEYVEGTPVMAYSRYAKSVKCSLNASGYNIGGSSSYPVLPPVTAVLKNNNTLWMWGGCRYGVIGNEKDYATAWEPYMVLSGVVSYDTSGYHSSAVTSDGSLYMWGYNYYGQVGNGTNEDQFTPVKILDGAVSVAVGSYFSAAVMNDGSVYAWGSNSAGQLGNGTTENSNVPVKVSGLNHVKQISLGSAFGIALKDDGSVWVWGYNGNGQLGLGNRDNQSVPVENENFDYDVTCVEAGYDFCSALLNNGDLYMWGENNSGQLGDKSFEYKTRPKRILRQVQQISLGYRHTLALKEDGTLWAWGYNSDGQLGDRSTMTRTSPAEISLGRINATFSGDGIQERIIDIPWDDMYLYDEDKYYNKDMAIDGIVLSEAAYNNPGIVFRQFGYRMADSSYNASEPSYYIGYKVTWDYDSPNITIIMAIRGTTSSDDMMTNIRSVTDSFDGAGKKLVNALNQAENKIIDQLKSKNISISLTKRNTTYFLTGHSLGGACAGKVGLMLVDDGYASANNVYVYTYASPTFNTDPFQSYSVPRMFNIIHDSDVVVPNLPKFMYNGIIPIPSWRSGYDHYYSADFNNSSFLSSLNYLYGSDDPPLDYDWGFPESWRAHMTPIYLSLLLSGEPVSVVKEVFAKGRLISVHCPVDIKVYSPEGDLCAYSENGEVKYKPNSTVIVTIIGDEKYVQIPDDREYSIIYTGIDIGTMEIEDQIYDIESGELEHEKAFKNVTLSDGKQFSSFIDGNDDTDNTDLYVIDDEGDKTHSVDENGNETKLAIYELDPKKVHITANDQQYNGSEKTAQVTVDDLTEGEDYRVIYENNVEVGTASVSVKGINLYEGRVTETFDIYDNGDIGEDTQWSLSADGTLTLSGSGTIKDFGTDDENAAPWKNHAAGINKVVVDEGIDAIGSYAFSDFAELTEAHIPTTVTAIGNSTFSGCEKLSDIYYAGDKESWSLISIGDNNDKLSSVKIHRLGEAEIPTVPTTEPPTELSTVSPKKNLLGDADGDEVVTILDVTVIQRRLASVPTSGYIEAAADADEDGSISILDATFIQRWLAKTPSNDHIGQPIG